MKYGQLRQRAATFDQKSKYHNLTLLEHIDKAVEYAKNKGYGAEVVEALEWHDFGKLFVFQEGEDGQRHFTGHAEKSAELYPGTNERIRQLILEHNTLITKRTIAKLGIDFCRELFDMQSADQYAHSEFARSHPQNIRNVRTSTDVLREAIKQDKITKRLKSDYEHLEGLGYEVVGVFLQGSQNYGLDTDHSDIDTKAIVLPTFDDFVLNRQPVSTTLEIGSLKEHIDVKDIRVGFATMKKGNINFTEILFTRYKKLNPKYSHVLAELFKQAEQLATWNRKALYSMIHGMAQEKLKALKHPYPSLLDKIERYGYDPKQLHHIIRLHDFLLGLLIGEPFKRCLISKNAELLKQVKLGKYALEEAELIAQDTCTEIKRLKDKALSGDVEISPDVPKAYDVVCVKVLRQWFAEQLKA